MSDLPKLGIDIGNSTIKLVELVPTGKGKWRLVTAASINSVKGGISGGSANLPGISGALIKLIKESGAKSRRTIAALPEEQVSSHVVEMPIMKDEELKQALQWQVEQYIPIPAEKAVWSHQVISKNEGTGSMEVLLVAAAKNLVNSYMQVLEQAGLSVEAMETELTATARSVTSIDSPLSVVVDIGSKSSDLGIISHGQLMFARTIPTAGESFTRAIETALGLDMTQAEEYKNTYGFSANQLGGKLVEAMKPVLNVIATEVKKTVDFYLSKHAGETVKFVTLSGGIATLPDIVGILSSVLGVEVVIGNPFEKVTMSEQQNKMLAGSGSFYAVATGLSMREL